MSTPALLDHQREGIEWLNGQPFACLWDEPGLGKTRQILESDLVEPVLALAPAMVLDSGTWDDEIEKWAPGLDITQVAYSSMTLRERTAKGGNRPTTTLKEELRGRWGSVVADESHYLKGRKTTWTLATQKLQADSFRQLTGTPIPNWAPEAFIPLRLTWPEESRKGGEFGSYWRWAKKWFHVGPTHWSPMAVGDLRDETHLEQCRDPACRSRQPVTWEEFRAENWGGRMLMRERADCLDLPPLTIQRFNTKMGAAQKKAYKELRDNFVTWLEGATKQGVAAWSTAGQLTKLLKCATGLEVLSNGEVEGSGKLGALATLLKDRPRPTLVVGHFRATVAACARTARDVGMEARIVDGGASKKERRDVIKAFQGGGLGVLCATLDTISEGMTLTSADQVIRVERSWRPSRNEQVVHRLHRIGQERPVICIDLVQEGTVDEHVLALLEAKSDQQMKALGKADLRELVTR